jgi:hypothetical protein
MENDWTERKEWSKVTGQKGCRRQDINTAQQSMAH